MRVVIGGASGFLGSALVNRLTGDGHEVIRLVRHATTKKNESHWDPANGQVDGELIANADVVINLSGAPIAHWPWTAKYRKAILSSRVTATATLANAIAKSPKPAVFLSASGMAHYGSDRGAEILGESASAGEGFLADVVHQWEGAASPAVAAGARVCFLRTSNVLHRDGGLLKPLLPTFKLGIGAIIGNGKQYFALISREDWVSAVVFLAQNDKCSGPYNLAAPNTNTNAYFTKAMGRAVHRPAFIRAPKFALTTVAGELGKEISGSLRVEPEALLRDSFTFKHASVEEIIDAALHD